MTYNIELPAYKPWAVLYSHAGASVYGTLSLHHKWLIDALNTGKYPDFMEVNAEGMITSPTGNKEPAIAMIRREALIVARDYYNLLTAESEQLAISDYIASIDSIQL